ncbi:hypothetical protein B484DRAFT_393333, partial [Ochromonadaceae sp. CCMP2298]
VVHCCAPKSVEAYLQEIGRAGRDGDPAACHLLLSKGDLSLQHSLGHSDRLSRLQVAALLLRVFVLEEGAGAGSSAVPSSATSSSSSSSPPLLSEVCLPLDSLEEAMDIPAAAAETLLSLLELPPFRLLSIKGQMFDSAVGRFRVAGPKLQALAEGDRLVDAMLTLNRSKAQSPEENVEQMLRGGGGDGGAVAAMNSNGVAGYGLGFDCSSSAAYHTSTGSSGGSGWDRDRKLSGSYGGRILDFSVSRLAVALLAGLTPEEVAGGLYSLQRRGLLEYKLQDNALHLLLPPATAADQFRHHSLTAYCARRASSSSSSSGRGPSAQQLRLEWVWDLSGALHTRLLHINDTAAGRVVDMWRAGSTIADYTQGRSISSREMGRGVGARRPGAAAPPTSTTSTTAGAGAGAGLSVRESHRQ